MTSLIDTIESVFHHTVSLSEGEVVDTEPVMDAIELYCKLSDEDYGKLEAIVDRAYMDTQHLWLSEWRYHYGEVAERVVQGLAAKFGSAVVA